MRPPRVGSAVDDVLALLVKGGPPCLIIKAEGSYFLCRWQAKAKPVRHSTTFQSLNDRARASERGEVTMISVWKKMNAAFSALIN